MAAATTIIADQTAGQPRDLEARLRAEFLERDLPGHPRPSRKALREQTMAERGIGGPSFMGACVAAFVAVAMWAPPAPVAAQSIADIFRGKTIKLLLPTAPGGGRALYALPFAEAYGRHIPGNPTVVPIFMPGAGGSTAVNNAYGVAAQDGLTIVSPLKSVVTAQADGDPSWSNR